ncbi:protein kinase [Hyalangium sp. s54d21]|uniref:Protein kinase n=2 Tax=Hyalangium rubrum TaxID=3103134 RepID=A0ABU5H832_9BACT|nr:protein kinase [Hyalangium sp. s54d21]
MLQRPAGFGGMGSVFLAQDELSGQPVALKLLHAQGSADSVRRFAREARLLASLRHPGIVSYVAHGLTEEGQPFLAMEWLEGEDLAQRLLHKPLSLSESLQLLRRASEALAVAHAQGIIHRDIKPSNLFLRAGQPHDVVLLDFGLAHLHTASQPLTGSAAVMGTPGYMAPEQASSLDTLTPRADIFSLGCVLYECLSGQAPFRAPHVAAVLARILFSEPVPLRTLRPELPTSLQALVERMLSKAPRPRPADARHLLRAMEALEAPFELPPPRVTRPALPAQPSTVSMPPEPPHPEQHLVSVLLATPRSSLRESPTLNLDEEARARQHLLALLNELQLHSAQAALLADGSLVATFVLERGSANDQASLAAHCALSVRERWPDSFVALTTGLSLRDRLLPAGEAVDKASELLHLQKTHALVSDASVLVDDTTAGLLGARFQMERASSSRFLLRCENLEADESRPLLGRPTPCVGREQELALLELAFTSCVEDSASRVLLITAPAGMGKSRLRHELLRRLERHARPPLMLLGRGEPMNTSTAHGLLGQAVRRLCEVVDGEPLEVRRARLAQRLTRHLPASLHKEVTEFLGELCAIPFPSEDNPRLRAAREDPQLMSALVTRALVVWLRAECAQGAVLWMLEDLHWSDGPSIKLMEEVLREFSEQPLMVLALARPEVKKLFPELWGRSAQEVSLRGLSQKACARLVHEVLGPQVPEDVVARLVGLAAGNALFLEELIRGVAEGQGEEPPGSVLAMLQSRLQRLEPEARRVVQAASIFGRTFWAGGVGALLAPDFSSEELAHSLQRLVELEVVQPQACSRFSAEVEYRFHHALVRDAAASLVPDSLRFSWHQRAGEWLESAGESEPLVLAEHYKLGGQKQKALQFFTRACKQNCERQRTDMQGALKCLKAALDCEPTDQALIELQVLEAEISFWTEDFERTIAVGREVLPKLAEGSASWIQVVGNLIIMNAKSGRTQEAVALGHQLLGIEPAPEAVAVYCEAIAHFCVLYQWTGQRNEALRVLERMGQMARKYPGPDSFAHAWWHAGQGSFAYYFDARPWWCQVASEEGMKAFDTLGTERQEFVARTVCGLGLAALGELSRAVQVMREGLERARYFDQADTWLHVHLALVLSGSAEPTHHEEARRMALHARETQRTSPMHRGLAALALARVALAQDLPSDAEEWAREACELLSALSTYQLLARTCRSTALLARGRALEARGEAEQGMRALERTGRAGVASVGLCLALFQACHAQRDEEAAEEALRLAMECLHQRARDLPDAATRERFLCHVPENARVLHLARQRWGASMEGCSA